MRFHVDHDINWLPLNKVKYEEKKKNKHKKQKKTNYLKQT